MEDIEKFKKTHYYTGDGLKLSDEVVKSLGLNPTDYLSLKECAYHAAYDISEDWSKETPEWGDVIEGYKRGAKDGIEYASLKWEDILTIVNLFDTTARMAWFMNEKPDNQKICEDTLKKFYEQKNSCYLL